MAFFNETMDIPWTHEGSINETVNITWTYEAAINEPLDIPLVTIDILYLCRFLALPLLALPFWELPNMEIFEI